MQDVSPLGQWQRPQTASANETVRQIRINDGRGVQGRSASSSRLPPLRDGGQAQRGCRGRLPIRKLEPRAASTAKRLVTLRGITISNDRHNKARTNGKWEVVRRLRYGALLKLFRHRYGYEFPDDDAGRDDLFVLLCVVSLAPSATDKKMAHVIDVWAPWMPDWERDMLVEHVNRLTIYERMPAAQVLGERVNLTNADRERLRLWPIKPVDMTVEQLMEQRKVKRREYQKQRRRDRGVKPRTTAAKPWEAEGIARSTWYHRQLWTRVKRHKTPVKPTIVIKESTLVPTHHQRASSKREKP